MANSAPVNGNVVGGYKAAISNPRVGAEAKENAKNVLKTLEDQHGDLSGDYVDTGVDEDVPIPADEVVPDDANNLKPSTANEPTANEGNVIGGYKATLSNKSSSEDAKERARAELDSRGVEY